MLLLLFIFGYSALLKYVHTAWQTLDWQPTTLKFTHCFTSVRTVVRNWQNKRFVMWQGAVMLVNAHFFRSSVPSKRLGNVLLSEVWYLALMPDYVLHVNFMSEINLIQRTKHNRLILPAFNTYYLLNKGTTRNLRTFHNGQKFEKQTIKEIKIIKLN